MAIYECEKVTLNRATLTPQSVRRGSDNGLMLVIVETGCEYRGHQLHRLIREAAQPSQLIFLLQIILLVSLPTKAPTITHLTSPGFPSSIAAVSVAHDG